MKRYWPVAVVVLIGTALSANIALVYLAASDPDFSVEPDYYAKALRWDEQREQERQNVRLGWTVALTVDPERTADGSQAIQVRLLDADAGPVGAASLSLTAFPNARSHDRRQAELSEGEDGAYHGVLLFHRPGLWEFRLVARRGPEVFTEILLEDVWTRPVRQVRGGR